MSAAEKPFRSRYAHPREFTREERTVHVLSNLDLLKIRDNIKMLLCLTPAGRNTMRGECMYASIRSIIRWPCGHWYGVSKDQPTQNITQVKKPRLP